MMQSVSRLTVGGCAITGRNNPIAMCWQTKKRGGGGVGIPLPVYNYKDILLYIVQSHLIDDREEGVGKFKLRLSALN